MQSFAMAHILFMAVMLHIFKRSSQMDCKSDVFDVSFDCQFHLTDFQSTLKCESVAYVNEDGSAEFYIFELHNKNSLLPLQPSSGILQSFLNATFGKNSAFYKCDSMFRAIIHEDQSILSNCQNDAPCIQDVSKYDLNVRTIEISNTVTGDFYEHLKEFPLINNVTIHHTLLKNISELQFANSTRLDFLILTNNNIELLNLGTFDKMQNLQIVDLSRNRIKAVPKFSFETLIRLNTLNLSYNLIDTLTNESFSGLANLTILDLSHNKLKNFAEKDSYSLYKLERNNTTVPRLSFEIMAKLNSLNLSYNLIDTLTNESFVGLSDLITLDLSNNKLKSFPEKAFHPLYNLEHISCSGCKLTEIHENAFLNTSKIASVDFSNNEIKTIPSNLFVKQHYLYYVNLSVNKLTKIPEFRNKSYLLYLELFQNDIQRLDENLSTGAPRLYYLNVSQNRIEYLLDSQVKYFRDLETLDISKNRMSFVQLGKQLGTKDQLAIRRLYLSENSIKLLNVNWHRLTFLEIINLDYNNLTYLDVPPCIPGNVKQTITFSFQYNSITELNMTSLIEDDVIAQKDRTKASDCFFNGMPKNYIDISYNSLNCNCQLYPLYKYLNLASGRRLASFIQEDNLTCSSPPRLKNHKIVYLPDDALSCPVDANCPDICFCGIRAKDSKRFVNCSGTGLVDAPQDASANTTVLYFNGNNLSEVESINSEFWPNLVELHADNNNLVSLEEWEIPPKLRVLSLRNNSIKELPQALMDHLTNQSNFELLLGGNDRNCECSRVNFKHFLKRYKNYIKDIENVVCDINSNGTTSTLALYTIPDQVLCTKVRQASFNSKVALISVCTMFGLVIIILIIYYKQRQLIMSFLYIHCDEIFRVCFEENEADEDKMFDAFIAYSSSDRQIVMDMLEELEEKEPHFQLCIHERNWLPGRFISDNIINSVQCSKRTIVVLSNEFISSPWFRLEMRAAIFKVSGDKRNKLIAILADKSTTLDGIDMEIRHVISKRTYLVWGERWFWEKLRYAMPRNSCSENGRQSNLGTAIPCKRDSEIALMEST